MSKILAVLLALAYCASAALPVLPDDFVFNATFYKPSSASSTKLKKYKFAGGIVGSSSANDVRIALTYAKIPIDIVLSGDNGTCYVYATKKCLV